MYSVVVPLATAAGDCSEREVDFPYLALHNVLYLCG